MVNKSTHLMVFACMLSSCMVTTKVDILQPAEIDLPERIKTILIIDRCHDESYHPPKTVLNIFDDPWDHIKTSKDAAIGLYEVINKNPRFEVVDTILEDDGPCDVGFPYKLSWKVVELLCEKYDAQMLASLEIFETDNDHISRYREVVTAYGTTNQYTVTWTQYISLGWRLYDPYTKSMSDEYKSDHSSLYQGKGLSEQSALANLPDPHTIIANSSYLAGKAYGQHISPSWISAERSYYGSVNGYPQMKVARNHAINDQWSRAAEIWSVTAYSQDLKTASKASFNMALACEVEGRLDLALEWIERAKKNGNNKAWDYEMILTDRIKAERKVKQQMEGN
ncbi:MAG: hypothetical protein IH946_09065 [Bacteroidetes bacterium]|nr:hypothetical protein [Bacteroidota bacterium]